MEVFQEMNPEQWQGVGAKAEASLLPLAPLIEYYEREMGELPGRLMIATSFLGDVPMMPGWNNMSQEVQQSIKQAQSLIVSVMVRLLNQQISGCKTAETTKDELQTLLDQILAEARRRSPENEN